MSEPFIEHNSFVFGTTDMWTAWELRILKITDYLKPKLRSRKVTIPLRSGTYDYGATAYDDRILELKCLRMSDISRSEQRNLAYLLSKKSQIYLYDDPEKYYIGRIYTEPQLKPIRNGGLEVILEFVCEPFAYGQTTTEEMPSRVYLPDYNGTAPTPTYIVIENVGETNAVNIQIVQTNRKENL